LLHENKDKAVLTLAANVGKSGAEIAERCYPVVYTFLTEGRGLIQNLKPQTSNLKPQTSNLKP
jgi:hypothetical protein